MAKIRIESVSDPFDSAEIARAAVATVATADAMGLLPPEMEIRCLDFPVFVRVLRSIRAAGIGQNSVSLPRKWNRASFPELRKVIAEVRAAMAESPVPRLEWDALERRLGAERLSRLVGVSTSSLQRYRRDERATPSDVADRLHFLALLAGDLAGAYNDEGIRRWFLRPRRLLDGRAPVDILRGNWSSASAQARRVRRLVDSLAASPAT